MSWSIPAWHRDMPRAWAPLVAALLTAGCATPDFGLFGQSPPKLTGAIVANEVLNANNNGVSTSVVLRIYQLKSPTTFEQTDFFSLYDEGEARLGPESLVMETTVLPGSVEPFDEQELGAETTHIGIMVAYRDWENANWRAVLETPAGKTTIANIQLDGSNLTVSKGSGSWLRKTAKQASQEPAQ